MPVHNAEIAEMMDRVAALLEIEGANPFRVRAYRNAARTVRELPHPVAEMTTADLDALPGIGVDLANKINAIADSGHFALLEEVERHAPKGLVELIGIGGLGPKRIQALHEALHVETPAQLEAAARAGRLRTLKGFGAKLETNILRDLAGRQRATSKRLKRHATEQIAEALAAYLSTGAGVVHITVAGSYRRKRETVGDLDILVAARRGSDVMARFLAHEDVERVVAQGDKRSTVLLRGDLQVDLRVVPERSYGAALVYFTGSKSHNIAIRRLGLARRLKINEYGVFRGAQWIGGRTEEDVYRAVGLPWIEPELREDAGEIEAAATGALPHLVSLKDIRGDLHCHTTATDGRNSMAELAEAARARGYEYIAITDHTRHLTVARGLDAQRLARQIEEIDRLNDRLQGFTILKGSEVDILEDGTLDLPDSILGRLDFTVCAVHMKFNLSAERQTERIIRAMDNPCFTILAHPTGRLISQRDAYPLDIDRVLRAALERGCFLEVNGQPDRLDLTDRQARMAKDAGVLLALSTDAHSTIELGFMRFAVDQARRGWIEPDDVLNTRPLPSLRKLLLRG